MAEGDVHKHLKNVALRWLKTKVTDLVANEVEFSNAYSIADAVGINLKRKEIRVIECKSTFGDFKRDKKLHGKQTSYFNHAHYSYIMCPTDIIPSTETPYGYGLLYVDEYDNITLVKRPIKNTGRLKTMFNTTLRKTSRALTNSYLFQEENKRNYDVTQGRFSRKSNIKLISVRCPNCKKTIKELIIKDKTKTIKCKCKTDIDLTRAKFREITGFNSTFIKKINELKDNT